MQLKTFLLLPIVIGTLLLPSLYTFPSDNLLPTSNVQAFLKETIVEELVPEKIVEIEVNPTLVTEAREQVVITPSGVQLHPNLVPICRCESGLRQFNSDGTVLLGRINPMDVGICQINLKYHGAAADKMALDLYTLEGNITYANRLYASEGARPWSWSAHCHGQH